MVANIHIGDHINSVPCEIAVAEHGTFRIAGRARSVKNNGQIVYTNANVGPISTRAIQDGSILLHRDVWLFSSGRLMGTLVNEDYPLNSRTAYTSNGKGLHSVRRYKHLGAGILKMEGNFRSSQSSIYRNKDRSYATQRKECFKEHY